MVVPILIVFSVLINTAGQLLFKQSAIFVGLHPQLNITGKYLFNPWFYGGVFLFGLSALIWVQILTHLKISVAYPILSISYILTALGAFYFFGERLSIINMVGILLIMLGVSFISFK